MSETVQDQNATNPNMFDRFILKLGKYIAILYFIAVIITVFEVFMRYVFGSPTVWVYETTVLFVGIAMLYGGTYCMADDGHIKVTFIRDMMPTSWQKINDFIVDFLTFLFTISLIYAGWIMVQKALWTPSGIFRPERSGSAWNSPMPAIIKVTLLIVVTLMAIQAFMQLISATKRLFRRGEIK
ncbi:MAG: TRAP transporter small permease subunit [Alphaproteobacteria bacterium]